MIYKNALITTKDKQFLGWIEIDDKTKILKSINHGKTKKNGFDCKNNILMPGFIDTHTHGGYGFSFDYLNERQKYLSYLINIKKEGVVAFIGTSVTTEIDELEKKLNLIRLYLEEQEINMPKMLGWYFEGPFISKNKKGAHEEKLIIPVDEKFLKMSKKILSKWPIIYTVDVENKDNLKLIKKYQNQFIFALGHSNASYKNASYSLNNGIKRITHLYNAMSGFHHSNKMGILNAIFNKEFDHNFNIELIADGVHVANEVIQFTYKNINIDNLSLITDSLPAKGLKNGEYKLGNLSIEKKQNWFYLKGTSTLSGSALPYNQLLKIFKTQTKCSWSEIVKVSSYNSAINLNLENNYGDFIISKRINFVLIDNEFNVIETFV